MTAAGIPEASGLRPVDLDPALANNIGLHHSLPTAIADLVDNSLDANAQQIRIRFLLDGTAPVGIRVIDNGSGMGQAAIDRAMTYAGTREYRESDLGHFGVGLKAASLSQADTALIYSRAYGSTAVARKLVRMGEGSPPQVGAIAGAVADAELDAVGNGTGAGDGAPASVDDGAGNDAPLGTGDDPSVGTTGRAGTIIEWRDVRTFPGTQDDDERRRWVQGAIRDIRGHLGVVLHRILESDGPVITVGTVDVGTGFAGPARAVTPIDPFDYAYSGNRDFPQELDVRLPDGSSPVTAVAHIWPSTGSNDEGFKIGGRPGGTRQGFFVYRRDRLIQIGGWCDLWAPRTEWNLARIALDLTDEATSHVTINPEKSGLELSADLRRAIESSVCRPSGLSFSNYLGRAAGEDRRGRSRRKHPVSVVEPNAGLPPGLLEAYREAVDYRPNYPEVDIRWRGLDPDRVFDIDIDGRELVLNLRYRETIVGERSLDTNDAPLVKALMHLLLEQYFAGAYLGERDKREVTAWNAILLAAIREQQAKPAAREQRGRHATRDSDIGRRPAGDGDSSAERAHEPGSVGGSDASSTEEL